MKYRRGFVLLVILALATLLLTGCSTQRGPVDPEAPAQGMWQALVVFPLTEALMYINRVLAGAGIPYSYGWSIIVFTILIKLVTLPLTIKQMQSTRAMQELQPQLQELQKKYAKDRETLAQKQMELYKEAGVNPMGGCLPLLIQFPILIGLYNALYRLAGLPGELEGQRFFWIPDLSFPDPTAGTKWLGEAWQAQDWYQLVAYLSLPILLVVTQIIVQKMTTTSSSSNDPQSSMMNQMMLIMPIMFGWITLSVPSGLALYWVVSNLLSLVQQYFTVRTSRSAPAAVKVSQIEAREPKIKAPVVESDDLALIKGIGHKTASVLIAEGITTFDDLAAADETLLADIMDGADLPPGDYTSWIRQAQRHVESMTSS